KSWILKEKNVDKSFKFTDSSGKALDMVNQAIAPQLGYPLSLFTYDDDLKKKLNEALYVNSSAGTASSAGPLTFEYSDGDITVKKTFRVDKDYVLAVETEVTRNGQRIQAFPQWPSGIGDQTAPASFLAGKIDSDQNGNIERRAAASGGFLSSK